MSINNNVVVGEAVELRTEQDERDQQRDAGRGGRSGGSGRNRKVRVRRTWRQVLKRDWRLYSLLVLPLIFLIIFRYVPMAGNVIAFRRFRPGGSMFGDERVGLRYVELFINDPTFWRAFWNTLILGGLTLLIVFPLPIILALMLNELRSRRFKRIAQSISYLPHFMSIVIVAGMVLQLTALRGSINQGLTFFGWEAIPFMQLPEWFRTIDVRPRSGRPWDGARSSTSRR